MRRNKLLVFLLTVAILLPASTSVLASSGRQKVEVAYRNIVVMVGGQPLANAVEPFVLVDKGTVMVPLRALAEALGVNADWDGQRNTVTIGAAGTRASGESSGGTPVGTSLESLRVLRNVGSFYHPEKGLHIANRFFAGGLAVEVDGQEGQQTAETVVELSSRYSRLEGYYGVEDDTMNSKAGFTLEVLGDDRVLAYNRTARPSAYPVPISLDVTGVNRLTLRVKWQAGDIGEYTRVVAALANVRFLP